MIFQDEHFYYLRKPAWWPSTWGKQECFLDKLESGVYEEFLQAYYHSDGYDKMLYEYFYAHSSQRDLRKVNNIHALIHYLMHTFSHQQEDGLVNRLDTDTTGFLYFAKDAYNYSHYKKRQNQWWIKKNYLAVVRGDIGYILKKQHKKKIHEASISHISVDDEIITISYPLMHHAQLDDRMVAIKERNDMAKWRWKLIEKETKIRLLNYNHFQQRSLIHIEINQWARHQIRAHLWAFWYPILWEKIYAKKEISCDRLPLHLRSIGCEVDADREVLKSFYKIWDKMNEPIHVPGDHSKSWC